MKTYASMHGKVRRQERAFLLFEIIVLLAIVLIVVNEVKLGFAG